MLMIKKGILCLFIFMDLLGFSHVAMAISYKYECSSEYCKVYKEYPLSTEIGALGVHISCASPSHSYLDSVDYENSLGSLCSLTNKTFTSLIISCFVSSIGSANWLKVNTVTCKTKPKKYKNIM